MGALDQYFLTGDWIGGILAIYTSRMGDLFYGALIYGLSFPAYMRTKRLDYIIVVWALVSGSLHILIPTAANTLAKLIIVGGLTTILYRVFVRSEI